MKVTMGIINKCGLRGDDTLCIVIFIKFGVGWHTTMSSDNSC